METVKVGSSQGSADDHKLVIKALIDYQLEDRRVAIARLTRNNLTNHKRPFRFVSFQGLADFRELCWLPKNIGGPQGFAGGVVRYALPAVYM